MSSKLKVLVSACLLGENCKYDSTSNYNEKVARLGERFKLIPVCPECFGGLPIPRVPSEILNGRVVNKNGEDVTAQFEKGADDTLYIANESNAFYAIFKERSPSCGFRQIYDGTFSKTLTCGNGVTADLLYNNGIRIFGETEIDKFLEEIEYNEKGG